MVNPGVVLLIILAIVLTIIVIGAIIWAAVEYSRDTNGTGGTGTTGLALCNQNINISTLIQIPNVGANCIQNGMPSSKYYIGQLGNQNFDYVVAPWGTQPLDVCIGFCTGYTGGICFGAESQGKSAQQNFDNCMTQLSSTTCIPPIPLAAKGTILYYAFSPTCNVCDNCG